MGSALTTEQGTLSAPPGVKFLHQLREAGGGWGEIKGMRHHCMHDGRGGPRRSFFYIKKITRFFFIRRLIRFKDTENPFDIQIHLWVFLTEVFHI